MAFKILHELSIQTCKRFYQSQKRVYNLNLLINKNKLDVIRTLQLTQKIKINSNF